MAGNERLRSALLTAGLNVRQLAEAVGVDPKTVERWVNTGRTPHPQMAHRAAGVLREDLTHLWLAIEQRGRGHRTGRELIAAYPTRATAPLELWRALFEQARTHIGILVYAANFLHESWPGFSELPAAKSGDGCRVRVMLGDPDSPAITARGEEERYGHGIESRCRVAVMRYRPLAASGVEVRLHDTTLYNSLFAGDDRMIVNAHVFGMNAYGAPVYHLRRGGEGGLFDVYAASLDAVWERSRPLGEGP
ncbi:XRE family transcriptional regulator [Nonomuraea sp. NPDC050540]|uniref:XRE family transcriptional regulator n=1 Tax=Nonomuraea sp. NPDC050540 TaxID=3364367 RepID=UPI00378B0E80